MLNIIVWQFKLMSEGHFGTLCGSCNTSAVELWQAKVQKIMFLQKHKMATRGLVWPQNVLANK